MGVTVRGSKAHGDGLGPVRPAGHREGRQGAYACAARPRLRLLRRAGGLGLHGQQDHADAQLPGLLHASAKPHGLRPRPRTASLRRVPPSGFEHLPDLESRLVPKSRQASAIGDGLCRVPLRSRLSTVASVGGCSGGVESDVTCQRGTWCKANLHWDRARRARRQDRQPPASCLCVLGGDAD